MADLPELVGFFSYSREDDEDSQGRLSALRTLIQGELRGQLGRTTKTFRLWQDKEAIPSGTLWENEIKKAVGQSVFFIPIITPTVVRSPYCKFELESFLEREVALGRGDLVFPILYIDVPELEDNERRQNDPVLSLIARRQYRDWRDFRYMDVNSAEVRREVGRFCTDVRNALRRHWISPEEREREQEAAALRQAEEDRQRREAEAKRRVEEEARQTAAEEERRKHEAEEERTRIAAAEAEARDDEQRRQRDETKAKRRAEAEEQRRLRQSQARPLWRPPIPVLAAGSLLGVVLLGAIGAWLALSPPPAPVTPTPPGLVTPAPTQQAAAAPLSAAQERALKTGDTFQECTNCPVMVVVPAGSFTMGSPQSEPGRKDDESPQHTVTIARHFAVGRVQITVDEFSAFAKATGYDTGSKCLTADFKTNQYVEGDGLSWRNPGFAQSGAHPAACWNWNDANAYADSLSKRTGKDYRLLTEAEYEYAIRARTTSEPAPRYFFGDDEASFCRYGNGLDETAKKTIPDFGDRPILPCSDGYAYTAPTGSFLPNGFGLYEMGSNIASWTQDCYHDSYNGAPVDGSAWTGGDCSSRVVRGGSWRSGPRFLRSAIRASYAPDQRINGLGFRVGRTLLAP